jgi:hypothetical protein
MLFQRKHPSLISSALLDVVAEGGSEASAVERGEGLLVTAPGMSYRQKGTKVIGQV